MGWDLQNFVFVVVYIDFAPDFDVVSLEKMLVVDFEIVDSAVNFDSVLFVCKD